MSYSKVKRTKNPDTPEATSKYYLRNSVMLPEVLKSKGQGKMTNELAKMLMMLTRKYAQRPCFSGYTYKEDMISEALTNLCQNALKFREDKSSNPFAFYTACIHNSFLQFLNVEKKHRRIRDQLLIDMGENPSYNFTEEHKSQQREGGEFQTELNELKNSIEEARVRVKQEAIDKANADAAAALLAAEEAALVAGADIAGDLTVEVTEEDLTMESSLLEFDSNEQ